MEEGCPCEWHRIRHLCRALPPSVPPPLLLGRRVGEVYRDHIEGGRTEQVVIDASRLGLSSGTYIVRIAGDRFAETHRLSVIRWASLPVGITSGGHHFR